MLAVQRNILYVYGGIFEAGNREYTLDDFHTLDLSKLDRFTCLRECPSTRSNGTNPNRKMALILTPIPTRILLLRIRRRGRRRDPRRLRIRLCRLGR